MKIVGDSGDCITLSCVVEENNRRYPCIVVNDDLYQIADSIECGNWMEVALKFSLKNDSLYLTFNSRESGYSLKSGDWNKIMVSFGKCSFPGYETEESAPVNLKNIRVFENGKTIRHWKLGQHIDNSCYDQINNVPAIAENPVWLIDRHVYWNEIYSVGFDSSDSPQYAYNAEEDILYVVPDEKSVICYNPVTNKYSVIAVKSGFPATINSNNLIYDRLNNELVSYNPESRKVSRFSFEEHCWDSKMKAHKGEKYYQHTAALDKSGAYLFTFGGYGHHIYRNDIFKLSIEDSTWEKRVLDSITPRYYSASVMAGDKLYIFGGRGSKTGKQEINPRNYYDLYRVDPVTYDVETVWKTGFDEDFMPCGNMVFNSTDSCFYVLADQGNTCLFRIHSARPLIEKVAGDIRQISGTDFNSHTLFYSDNLKKIFALVYKNYRTGSSRVSFYEISYPPLPLSDTVQQVNTKNRFLSVTVYFPVILIVVFFSLFAVVLMKKRKRKTEKKSIRVAEPDKIQKDEIYEDIRSSGKMDNPQTFTPVEVARERNRQYINLLGAFAVFDKNGKDISEKFAPKLKSLFLLLLLNTEKDGRGITDEEIEDILWLDKDRDAARNNRGVYLRKLQLLLNEIGDIEIEKNSRYRKIKINDNTVCDYFMANRYICRALEENTVENIDIITLTGLLSSGVLLPHASFDWLDKFKAEYSEAVINIAEKIISTKDKSAVSDKLALADIIFMHDCLNEYALKIKCSVFYKEGKKGRAKNIYDSFCRDYLQTMGEEYPIPFSDFY